MTNNTVKPVADIAFAQMTSGAGGTATHFAIGTDPTGSGRVVFYGTITPAIVVVNGVVPRLTTATTITED